MQANEHQIKKWILITKTGVYISFMKNQIVQPQWELTQRKLNNFKQLQSILTGDHCLYEIVMCV